MEKINLGRRSILRATAIAGGGMMLGLFPRNTAQAQAPAQGPGRGGPPPPGGRGGFPARAPLLPANFVSISPDGIASIGSPNAEMGQGSFNLLPMMVAEELDNRDTFANRERFPEAVAVHVAEYEEVFPRLAINETSYIIIVTRGHRDDMRVLELSIATEARYIAMIGSKRKVLNVICELEKQGIAPGVRAHPCAHGAGHRGDLP